MMLLVQAGWWLNGTRGLDPARSQLGVLDDVGRGRTAYHLSPWSVRRAGNPAQLMTVRMEEPGVFPGPGPEPWGAFNALPAGVYEVEVQTNRPLRGQLAVLLRSSSRPFRDLPVEPLSRQRFTLFLPAGADSLTFVPDRDLAGAGGLVELRAVRVDPKPIARARSATSYQFGDVFFCDDGVFAEEEGFWVAGQRQARFVIAARNRSSVTLHLRNGDAQNAVMIESGPERRTLTLAPGEERDEVLPLSALQTAAVAIASASGFRPSDREGADRRLLGVWVELR